MFYILVIELRRKTKDENSHSAATSFIVICLRRHLLSQLNDHLMTFE